MRLKLFAVMNLALLGLVGTSLAQESKVDKKPAVAPSTNAAPSAAAVSTNQTAAREAYIVIGYLERRDGTVITIKSGSRGAIYSVASKAGKVLFDNLSSEQLRAQAPELHDFIKSAVAADMKVKRMSMDARF